jgi:pimeloyl-ACP methyl ester carboxylesterase
MNRPPGGSPLQANGVQLCVETFGDPGDPAVLLIAGSSASMDWWEDDFCRRLADGSRFVIRYDHRDTGQSVSYAPGAPPYSFRDLVADAAGVLGTFGPRSAHVVGMSMGGAIAQLLALDSPYLVASLTLIAASPMGPGDPSLPGMSEETRAAFSACEPEWSDRAAVVDHLVHLARASAARTRPFDEPAFRDLAVRVVDRTVNIESSMTNHNMLHASGLSTERLRELRMPTLVVHGAEDPVLPYGHALALAREVPGASLLRLERTGHELPRTVWDVVVPAILEHTSGR